MKAQMNIAMLMAVAATVACTAQHTMPAAPIDTSPDWLFAWTASVDTARKAAFLTVIDLRIGSPTVGKVVGVVPAGPGGSGTHHTEHSLQQDGLLFADDFGLGRTSIFDLNDGANPKLHASFTTAGPFGWPHSYARLPGGNRLVTYQWQATKFNSPPGGLAEVTTEGKVVRWASAKTAAAADLEITPYSLELVPKLDRVVSTTTSMIDDTGVHVQIWRLSDLTLLNTVRIPGGAPHGSHAGDTAQRHLFPGEPRVLRDGKTVMLATFTCGLYAVTGIETAAPRVTPVYAFEGKNCAVPVVMGKYWLQTVPDAHAVVVLDISNPMAPREVSRVELGTIGPHWLARDASGRHLVTNSGSSRDSNLYLLDFDPATGRITRDARLPVVDLSLVSVPGVGEVAGAPHGAVFSR